jgi:hypothetical protein
LNWKTSQLHKISSLGGANTSTPSTSLPPFSGNTARCLTPAHGAHKLLPTRRCFQVGRNCPVRHQPLTTQGPTETSRPAHTNQVCLDTDPQLDPTQPGTSRGLQDRGSKPVASRVKGEMLFLNIICVKEKPDDYVESPCLP